MGLDRVVILLINSSDMSVAVAAGTAPHSPTKPWAGPPTGTFSPHTHAGLVQEKNEEMTKTFLYCCARECKGK